MVGGSFGFLLSVWSISPDLLEICGPLADAILLRIYRIVSIQIGPLALNIPMKS